MWIDLLHFNIVPSIFFVVLLMTDQVCSTKIFRSAIFSVFLKFGACYITGRWGYLQMKTATLWCLIDISTLINFSKFFELGHSTPPSSPAIKFWEKLNSPQLNRFLGFFQAPCQVTVKFKSSEINRVYRKSKTPKKLQNQRISLTEFKQENDLTTLKQKQEYGKNFEMKT